MEEIETPIVEVEVRIEPKSFQDFQALVDDIMELAELVPEWNRYEAEAALERIRKRLEKCTKLVL